MRYRIGSDVSRRTTMGQAGNGLHRLRIMGSRQQLPEEPMVQDREHGALSPPQHTHLRAVTALQHTANQAIDVVREGAQNAHLRSAI